MPHPRVAIITMRVVARIVMMSRLQAIAARLLLHLPNNPVSPRPMRRIIMHLLPFVLVILACLMLITYFPFISLTLR